MVRPVAQGQSSCRRTMRGRALRKTQGCVDVASGRRHTPSFRPASYPGAFPVQPSGV